MRNPIIRAKMHYELNRRSELWQRLRYYNPLRFNKSSVFLAFVFFYFAFHLVTGERGLLAYVRLKNEMETVRKKADAVQAKKLELSKNVAGLRDDNLNLDLLEELARKDLGYSKKDEVVLFEDDARK